MQAKNFIFTIPNYDEETIKMLEALPTLYLIYGFETCPTTGTPHL